MKTLTILFCLSLAFLTAGLTRGAEARLIAKVDLSSQSMTVSDNGKVLYRWPVSTARKGYRTPTGTWSAKRVHRMWHSRKYDMSPMPYSVFYNGGYAIHGTGAISKLGRPASHGCVRLHPANAKRFYNLVRKHGMSNTRVVVQR
ncbi:L,D-transpeptidase [Fulvimarina endophytica]|uniref:L,D-transpeptidase n=1 Tax=Fulvimarina endophytica TaxID=2293836 RepID=A0A371X784_9HYPH|nr:L,D-transpeptidase [Fulvimarina endophytica]RFC65076.1 L,D-transpeptidase [Fulvimarina endophytica]